MEQERTLSTSSIGGFGALLGGAAGAACLGASADAIFVRLQHPGRPYGLELLGQCVLAYAGFAGMTVLVLSLARLLPMMRLRGACPFGLGLAGTIGGVAFVFGFRVVTGGLDPASAGSLAMIALLFACCAASSFGIYRCVAKVLRPSDSRPRRLAAIAGTACAALFLAAAWGGAFVYRGDVKGAAKLPGAAFRNVVLISLDTTRRDHLSVYGYDRPTSPRLEELARGGAMFTNASSHATYTLSSHASMLTGMLPSSHEATMLTQRLDDDVETLAETLGEAGFATGAFVANYVLSNETGMSRGFETYDDIVDPAICETAFWHWYRNVERAVGVFVPSVLPGARPHWLEDHQRTATEQNRGVLSWIDRHREDPFFLFLNYYDPHWPYDPIPEYREAFAVPYDGPIEFFRTPRVLQQRKKPLTEEDRRYLRSLYDAEIAYLDAEVGRVFDRLEKLDLLEETLVIITSDHGEHFGEQGYFGHKDVYETGIGVPLIVHLPGAVPAGSVVTTPVHLVDLAPTVLDLAGVDVALGTRGTSLVPAMQHGDVSHLEARPVLAEDMDHTVFRRMARIGDLKLIIAVDGEVDDELYDLAADPKEETNLLDENGRLTPWGAYIDSAVLKLLYSAVEALDDPSADGAPEIDERTRQALRALGYVQ